LPPFFSIGFHYSKWEDSTSANRIMEHNRNFENANMPLDVLWMDLPYTDGKTYFVFNKSKFMKGDMDKMI
jgi:alpha 1,3-glucosidase